VRGCTPESVGEQYEATAARAPIGSPTRPGSMPTSRFQAGNRLIAPLRRSSPHCTAPAPRPEAGSC
jgi:hypothetical protein